MSKINKKEIQRKIEELRKKIEQENYLEKSKTKISEGVNTPPTSNQDILSPDTESISSVSSNKNFFYVFEAKTILISSTIAFLIETKKLILSSLYHSIVQLLF